MDADHQISRENLDDLMCDLDVIEQRHAFVAAVAEMSAQLKRIESIWDEFIAPRKNEHEWQIAFAGTLGFAWRRLTGQNPSAPPESPFLNFVTAAYQSLDPDSMYDWNASC
ncbi:MAG: hypothetical protein ACYC5H_13660 [Methylovirgula sp.]